MDGGRRRRHAERRGQRAACVQAGRRQSGAAQLDVRLSEDVFPLFFQRRFVVAVDEDMVEIRLPRAELEAKVHYAQAMLLGGLAPVELDVHGEG